MFVAAESIAEFLIPLPVLIGNFRVSILRPSSDYGFDGRAVLKLEGCAANLAGGCNHVGSVDGDPLAISAAVANLERRPIRVSLSSSCSSQKTFTGEAHNVRFQLRPLGPCRATSGPPWDCDPSLASSTMSRTRGREPTVAQTLIRQPWKLLLPVSDGFVTHTASVYPSPSPVAIFRLAARAVDVLDDEIDRSARQDEQRKGVDRLRMAHPGVREVAGDAANMAMDCSGGVGQMSRGLVG